ncbi:MAG: hypothetical protein IJY15_11525 [Thermoguttaceae bacterium]|nr:hypothetical protein [Thermoguttaceae bacterium]
MKFFFCAGTQTASRFNGESKRLRWQGALSVALAALCVVGCVGRKQYAINEAILVSERRQLEDEIYRLQFELRDALEENERLRQELGGDEAGSNSPTSRTRTRSRANDAFFPGLDAAQAPLRTTGGAQKIQTTSANDARPARPTTAPQNADAAPATGEAVETLPDYVPIPVTSTQPSASRTQVAQIARYASTVRNGETRSAQHYATTPAAPQNAGKTLGVRRVVPVASSNENGGEIVAPVFVDAPSPEKPSANVDAWSPLAQ